MGSSLQSMSEQSLSIHSYEFFSTNVGMMESSPIMAKLKALMEEKPPEDTPAMPIPPKPLHSTACTETTTIIAPHQTTAAMMTPDHDKEPWQQAFTFDQTTHDWLTPHPRNNLIPLVEDNRATKATSPHLRVTPGPHLRNANNPQMVMTNSVTTVESQHGRMRNSLRSSPQAGLLTAKELGQNKWSAPSFTDTQ